MSVRYLAATRRRAWAVWITVIVAFVAVSGETIALAQGVHATSGRPAQGNGTPNNFNSYGIPQIGGYAPYLVKDPTADERAVVAGRVYRAVLDEWPERGITTLRQGREAPEVEARSKRELTGRLGPWSLRWREAQDNAARSRAARYQSMADHLGRMSALENRRSVRETGQATGGPIESKALRGWAEVARFFRPVDEWDSDRISPTLLQSGRPVNAQGVGITPAEQVEIADRVYHVILDEAVDRVLASPRQDDVASINALLAERLAFWSDLWRQSQDDRDRRWRALAVGDRSSGVASVGARAVAPAGPVATLRSHLERMSKLENGRFADDALKRAGRSDGQLVDMTRFPEFTEVVGFFRAEAASGLPGAMRPNGSDVTAAGQAAIAGRIYRAILDRAARRYREPPRAGDALADISLVFDPRLAERLAAWSIRWARSQARADLSRVSQFNAIRSHIERMASLEDGRSLNEAIDRTGPRVAGVAGPAPPREFTDVARFFRLEAVWELAQVKSR